MRAPLCLILSAAVALFGSEAEAPVTPQSEALSTQEQRFAYLFAYSQVGNYLKDLSKDLQLDHALLVRGIEDALAGNESLVPLSERETLFGAMQTKMEAKGNKESEDNAAAGAAYMAKIKEKEGVTVLPSGLAYEVIRQGSGPKPTREDSVSAHYKGTLIDGKEFDSSYSRGEPSTFGVTGVIPGWTEALQLMNVGSIWRLHIPSDLAYGPQGRPGSIPPNATLVFEVELVDIVAK